MKSRKKIVFVLENLRCAVVGVCVAVVAGMEKFHVWLFVIPISSRINGIRLTSISFHILMRITSREEQLQLATCHCHTHKQFCFFLKCSDRFILLYKLFIFISKKAQTKCAETSMWHTFDYGMRIIMIVMQCNVGILTITDAAQYANARERVC